jgi:transposase
MTVTVLSGPERRRRWTSAEKLRIVEECLAPEAVVAEVARRHDIHPNQLHAWRRQARLGLLTSGPAVAAEDGCRFVPVAVATDRDVAGQWRNAIASAATIEVALRNGRLLRLPKGMALARVVALADALERR